MKRVFIVAVFLVCLCVPLFVKADMDAPSVKEYTASVSNPEGAITYSYEENEVVKNALGEKVFNQFYNIKRAEWDAYRIQVFDYERDEYLDV